MKLLVERYEAHAEFAILVKSIEAAIYRHGFTPMELRQAVFLACVLFEWKNVRPILADLQAPPDADRVITKYTSLDPDL
jgi:hypothetical protein